MTKSKSAKCYNNSFENMILYLIKYIYTNPVVQIFLKLIKYNYEAYIYPIFNKDKFTLLSRFKSIGDNKRIFIVATGPSLTIEDLNLIKNEVSMSCNSIVNLFDKTEWRPNYYTVIDHYVYKKIKESIYNNQDKIPVFFHPYTIRYNGVNSYWIKWRRVLAASPRERKLLPTFCKKIKFNKDLNKVFHEDTSVMHACMQLAIAMGYSEIILLGCDTTFVGHSMGIEHGLKDNVNTPYDYYIGAIRDYETAKSEADKIGVKIVNATRGGQLEVFDRVNLEDILKTNLNK